MGLLNLASFNAIVTSSYGIKLRKQSGLFCIFLLLKTPSTKRSSQRVQPSSLVQTLTFSLNHAWLFPFPLTAIVMSVKNLICLYKLQIHIEPHAFCRRFITSYTFYSEVSIRCRATVPTVKSKLPRLFSCDQTYTYIYII